MNRGAADTTSGSTSSSLIGRAKANDPIAWQQLCRVYGPLVYRWARQAGLQDSDASDVGQEVFRTVAARLADFSHEQPHATFRGWLWTITHHKLGDFLRRRAAHPEATGGTEALKQLQSLPAAPPEDTSPSLQIDARAGVVLRAIDAIRQEFEPTTWQAFWLSAVEGRSPDAVGNELGITRRAVIQRAYRVRRRLREELGGV